MPIKELFPRGKEVIVARAKERVRFLTGSSQIAVSAHAQRKCASMSANKVPYLYNISTKFRYFLTGV